MRIALDTNVLVRFLVGDDPHQQLAARSRIATASRTFVPMVVLCELVWVLSATYRFGRAEIVRALHLLAETDGFDMDQAAFHAGLAMQESGGDFADGVVMLEAQRNRCEEVLTFDRRFARVAGTAHVTLLK